MLKNYLIVAIRNLKRNYVFTGINILGLTLGLAISSIIVLYLINELTYDTYHKDSKQIYRLFQEVTIGAGAKATGPEVNATLGPYLVNNYPDIINQTRISRDIAIKFKLGENSFNERIFYADTSIFQIFTLKFKSGNPETALKEPFSLVLTEKMANKFFGNVNPIGKIITGANNKTYTVTAVIKNIPENSHFKFDILSSFESLYSLDDYKDNIDGWGLKYLNFYTYIKVKKEYNIKKLNTELSKIVETYLSENSFFKYKLSIQPLEQIYLKYDGGGSISRIILFSIVGILILLIPCINYMNLNTAESIRRLKEVGIRKVVGATQKQLVKQFLYESILISLVSLILAITLAEIILPIFNSILNKNLAFNYLGQWYLSFGFVIMALFAGILAGSYPAFYLSSFNPHDALKGKFVFGSRKAFLRNSFIVLQFAISIFLICCTGIILMQIRFSNNSDLGFNKENIITIRLPYGSDINPNLISEQLIKVPEISNLSLASGVPYIFNMFGNFSFDELYNNKAIEFFYTDVNYFDLLEHHLIDGRKFSKKISNENNNVIINETLAKELNWEKPIGQTFKDSEGTVEYTIIGIVKDFHTMSFHNRIMPCFLAFSNDISNLKTIVCKVNEGEIKGTLKKISTLVDSTYPDIEIEIQFLEQVVEKEYEDELRTGYMFVYFAIIAMFITIIGLYGLALFIAKQKTKEIGIRKIFGSSIANIVKLLSKQFLKIIVIALAISIPAAWYYTNIWLKSFVFQIENKWIIYAFASIIVVLISFITILYQSLKAATSNPINAIRYE